jgi:hypothetical protein
MPQNNIFRLDIADQDDVGTQVLITAADFPEQLFGSRMERETYLDNIVNEMMISSHIPQSRS